MSGPGRLHDLTVQIYGATPGMLRTGGEGLEIRYGRHPTPFGECLVALTDRGICALRFVGDDGYAAVVRELRDEWPCAVLRAAPAATAPVIERVFAPRSRGTPLAVHLAGTNFQIRVWEALLRIPPGAVASYADVAQLAGVPNAVRAVASAVARNPVAVLIPCHRVIRATGALGEYRWGTTRKQVLFGWEAAHTDRDEPG